MSARKKLKAQPGDLAHLCEAHGGGFLVSTASPALIPGGKVYQRRVDAERRLISMGFSLLWNRPDKGQSWAVLSPGEALSLGTSERLVAMAEATLMLARSADEALRRQFLDRRIQR